MNETVRKVAALVILAAMLATGFAFGKKHGPCYGAYRESGLTQQQITFHHFRTSTATPSAHATAAASWQRTKARFRARPDERAA